MPADKPVEARRQTQHKLETMDRYWRTWGWILAHNTKAGFCSRHLWFVDTMAGAGRHDSIGSIDGYVPGSPFQAVLAARANQQAVPGVTFHVRAVDSNPVFAHQLEGIVKRYRGAPPDGVDVTVQAADWRQVAAAIAREIRGRCNIARLGPHDHRSLWFIDPFGVEPLDVDVIDQLPPHAEVIVNFDENSLRRFAGRDLELLERVFRDDRWKAGRDQPLGAYAEIFKEQFRSYAYRNRYGLWASGAQDRFLIHLTHHPAAIRPFAESVKNGLAAGTLIAGELLTVQQKRAVVARLSERFRGQAMSVDEMYAAGAGASKIQIRTLAQQAADDDYGRWDPKTKTMTWFEERYVQGQLDL